MGATLTVHSRGYSIDEATRRRLRALSAKEYLVMRALCSRLLAPDAAGAPTPELLEAALVIDGYLAGLPETLRSDVKALLQLVEHSPPLFALVPGRVSRLEGPAQDAVLRGWQDSHLDLRRQGFQALKGLAMIGYYDDPRTFAVLDYPGPMIGLR